jgi:predicted phage gp36 major capsid-like protein
MKFKDLKVDYKQMLDSFEKSEAIRREQKQMIHDQKHEIKHLRNALRKSEKLVKKLKSDRWNNEVGEYDSRVSQMSRTSTQRSLKSSRSRTPKQSSRSRTPKRT